MNLDELKQLLKFMEENNLAEVEYEVEGKRMRLRKAELHAMSALSPLRGTPQSPSAPQAQKAEVVKASSDGNLVEFKSPLVGTFYRSPKPDAEPFVREGDEIAPEKVLCIIEAMKVMNEIKAEMNGVVRQVVAKNGQAVEYGEVIFVIEKK